MEQHLSQYKIFYEVAQAGNISKAAKELYISQPAISKAISKLEDSLEINLFTRNSRGVALTEEGLILYDHVKAAFEALTRGENELKRMQDLNIGHLRIGVSNTLCRYILLPYLKKFIQCYPHININIECQSTSHTLDMLEQQHIDIGLIAKPEPRKGLSFLPVMEIEDCFVSSPQYIENLYLREGADTDIFQTGNIMLLDKSNMTRHYIDKYLSEHNIGTNHLLEVTTMDLLVEFAKIGLGISCVIKDFVKDELNDKRLVEIPLGSPIRRRTIGFAYEESLQSTALQTFLEFI